MNPYRNLMEKCSPADGFQERLKEKVLRTEPGTRRIYRPRPALRTVLSYALIAFALAATAGAVWMAVNWDPIFMKRFSPSEPAKAQMESSVQTAPVSAQCGDVTLTVRQAMGDDKTVYAVLDITLPDSMPLSEFLAPDPVTGDTDLSILPDRVQYFAADTAYEAIAGMTPGQAEQSLGSWRFPGGNSSGVSSQDYDLQTNTLTFLIYFSTASTSHTISGQPLTILIDRLVRWTGSEQETVLEGPFLISWTPTFDAASYTYEITDGKTVLGTVTLSAFAIKARLYRSDYASMNEFAKTITLTFRDGSTYLPNGAGGGGSYCSPSGAVSYSQFFKKILLLEDVVSIQVADQQIKIQS